MHPSKQLGLHASNRSVAAYLPVSPQDTLSVLTNKNQKVGKQLILFQRGLGAAPAGWVSSAWGNKEKSLH